MDIQKPLQMIDGLSKMFNDAELKAKGYEMRQFVSTEWLSMTESEQEELYTQLCQLFKEMAEKYLARIGK